MNIYEGHGYYCASHVLTLQSAAIASVSDINLHKIRKVLYPEIFKKKTHYFLDKSTRHSGKGQLQDSFGGQLLLPREQAPGSAVLRAVESRVRAEGTLIAMCSQPAS